MSDVTHRTKPREHAKLWRDASLDNLELLRANFVTQTFAPHTHETYAIGIVEGGVEYFDYRGQRELAGAGAIGIIHPGEWHTGGPQGAAGWRYCALYPDAVLMKRAMAAMDCKPCGLPFFREPVIDDPEMVRQFRHVHAASENNAPEIERESRLIWVLALLIQRHADFAQTVRPIKPTCGLVAKMVDYLHDNLSQNIRLAELSHLTQLSEFQLLRTFRAEMGLPPHAYLNQLRVEQAKLLLFRGVPPVDVAAQVGFADQSHLTRRFKRMVGATPGAVVTDRSNS
jgi:AraC-like DNA-binding protein